MIARSETCNCHGIPHRRLIVENVVDGNTYTLLSICEWVYWLMRECCGGYGECLAWPDPTIEALAKAGLEPTDPHPEWREALSAMDD